VFFLCFRVSLHYRSTLPTMPERAIRAVARWTIKAGAFKRHGVAALAQLVEQSLRKRWVRGSSPLCGTTHLAKSPGIRARCEQTENLWAVGMRR
jgi:hypothetical protein